MPAADCKMHRVRDEEWDERRCPPCLRRISECRIGVLQSPCLWHPRACSKAAPSPRELEHRAFRGLHPRNHADGSAQGSHVVRTFLSTLCHEFCHHLDFQKFGFLDSKLVHCSAPSISLQRCTGQYHRFIHFSCASSPHGNG